jgi:zinc transporter 1
MLVNARIAHDERDYGMLSVALHLFGDALNNIGVHVPPFPLPCVFNISCFFLQVMISALIIWFAHGEGRHYADPAISTLISMTICASAIPLLKKTGLILLESAPHQIDLKGVENDIISVRAPMPAMP